MANNIFSDTINFKSEDLSRLQNDLEAHIAKIQGEIEDLNSVGKLEPATYNKYHDNIEKDIKQVNKLKTTAQSIKEKSSELNEKLNMTKTEIDNIFLNLNKNKLDFGLQGLAKNKLKNMPTNNFTETQKQLINSPYKRKKVGGKK